MDKVKTKVNKDQLVISLLLLLLASCTTFTIPVESFEAQMIEARDSAATTVQINNPLSNGTITYLSNNIESLIVVGKDGKEYTIQNHPSIEMRITDLSGKKHILYFDTVILKEGILKGSRSRLVSSLTSEIPLVSIALIEIQDGKKNFQYMGK